MTSETEQQRATAVDAAALDELRRAYRALREAQAQQAAAVGWTPAEAVARLTEEQWAPRLQAGDAMIATQVAFERAAEAFCEGLGEAH